MTLEELVALTIVFTAIGIPCLSYWLYKTKDIEGWHNKILDGPLLPQIGIAFMFAHYALMIFVICIAIIKQLL